MKQHGTFPIVLQEENEGGYSVTNLSLEGCYSQGETVEDALANIKEATLLCLEDEKTLSVARARYIRQY
jgi:predicted RNase H-like HicB family nuclease